MKITTEQMQSIYKKAMEYCKAKYGKEPDNVYIQETGLLEASYVSYHCGDADYEYYYFNIESLSEDLEKIYNKRKIKEEEERILREKQAKEKQIQYDIQQKEERKQEYLKLKKEFEQ